MVGDIHIDQKGRVVEEVKADFICHGCVYYEVDNRRPPYRTKKCTDEEPVGVSCTGVIFVELKDE